MKYEKHLNLNLNYPSDLRNVINYEPAFSMYHKSKRNGSRDNNMYPSWNRICAIMDRIEMTAKHVNTICLSGTRPNEVFSFYDLVNHSAVLINCISDLAKMFNIDIKEDSDVVFHKKGKDNSGNDKMYFEYIRSLCAVHPIDTSHQKMYRDTEFECCPYVIWDSNDPFLSAMVYTNKEGNDHKIVKINIEEVIEYVENCYEKIKTYLIPGIEDFKRERRLELKKQSIKTETEFEKYVDYLDYLIIEYDRRFGDDYSEYIKMAKRYFALDFTYLQNMNAIEKYRNILKLSISFMAHAISEVSFDGFENRGLVYTESLCGYTLLETVLSVFSCCKGIDKYYHDLNHCYDLLSENEQTRKWALSDIMRATPFLEKYVDISEPMDEEHMYVLVQVALYAECLKSDTPINRNVPRKQEYRL